MKGHTPLPKPEKLADMVTTRQAAEWVGVSVLTIRTWIVQGRLAAYNVGRPDSPIYRVSVKSILERFELVQPLVLGRR